MSRTLEISDELYSRLEATAKSRGLESIDRLLEENLTDKGERTKKGEAFQRIQEIQAKMSAKYGVMPDSTDLVREDRQR